MVSFHGQKMEIGTGVIVRLTTNLRLVWVRRNGVHLSLVMIFISRLEGDQISMLKVWVQTEIGCLELEFVVVDLVIDVPSLRDQCSPIDARTQVENL